MPAAAEDLVRQFCAAFARRDTDELVSFFKEGAVYHNMPGSPVQGTAAIKAVLDRFLQSAQSVEFIVLSIASAGETVHTERLDRFTIGERRVELPVAGVFEVQEGKIAAWRDYFDMATWTRQTSPAPS